MELDRNRQIFFGALVSICGVSIATLGFFMQRLFANRELADLTLKQSISLGLQVSATVCIVSGAIYIAYSLRKRH